MEPEVSLPHSQQPDDALYRKPDESKPQLCKVFLYDPSYIILPTAIRSSYGLNPLEFPAKSLFPLFPFVLHTPSI
jgi:hypothetical protein